MSDPIRMLHFADLHVGMENYGSLDPTTGTSSRVADFLDRLDELIDYALSHEADLAIFAGDAFKDRNPEPTQQREFAQRIKRLADAVPTLLLVGNHDMPGMAAKANSLDIFRALDVPGVIVGYRDEGRVVETHRGPVYLAWMPYPMRNRLMSWRKYQGKSIDELNKGLRAEVASRLEGLAEEAGEHAMPRVLAGHFGVDGAKFGSERSVMLGRDLPLLTSMLTDSAWDYVALGHIHQHQVLNPDGYPPVVYSGSLERIDFGEEHEAKGFCWVELERGGTSWKFVPVQARPFKTIDVDVRGQADPTAAVLGRIAEQDLEGQVVRVRIRLTPPQSAALNERELEAALETTASHVISRELEIEARARLGELSPEELTPLELVEQYLISREVDEERRAALLEKAAGLLDG
jgi:exonuclease SbcD